MSWFEEQLRARELHDDAEFSDSLDSIANAIMGNRLRDALSQNEIAGSAMDEILKYYHCKPKNESFPSKCQTVEEQIAYRMRPFGIMYRSVTLEKGWYRHSVGAMLGTMKENGAAVALIPSKISGYTLVDIQSGKRVRLNRKTEQCLDKEAVCFYEPLPQRALSIGDMMKFMVQQLNAADVAAILLLMAISAAMGLLSPLFTRWLFGDVLASGNWQVLVALAVFMICFSMSQLCFNAFQALMHSRIEIKQNIAVQAAIMNRILSLSPSFFKGYSAGELAQRASYVQSLCSNLFNNIGMTGLTSLFSLIYIGQIFTFAPTLAVPSFVIILLTLVISLMTTFAQMRISSEKMNLAANLSGMTYSAITGIQKIKLAGAEKRMFSRWAKLYAKEAQLEYNPPMFLKLSRTISLAVSLIGTLFLYAIAIRSQVGVADYYAFSTAYGMVSSAFMALSSIAVSVATIRPTLQMANPILQAIPEAHKRKEIITELRGAVELSHVSFRYDESMPNVIDDLSLRIPAGKYVAIVGPTGCGKSTLLRLLLGFETPQKGIITYDKKDITKMDLESLRKRIGVVMQDGKLFHGDIYSNIVITAPQLTVDDAWKAAEIAAVAEDIREMPMGMFTVICEGQGGISGGQKQRLMIARAVASNPSVLMFDEATSALDNITQQKVSDAVDTLHCTRIVIAHRLSTIRHADRILYMEHGKIMEDGTYEELMSKNGGFARLVERQQLTMEV